MRRFCESVLLRGVAAVFPLVFGAKGLAQGFLGDISDSWFLVSGPVESRGTCWDPSEVKRMKQGMKLYVHFLDNGDGSYRAEAYSITADPGEKCWQIQGVTGDQSQLPEYGGIQIHPSEDGREAFFIFFGKGFSYRDPEPGNWIPVEHNQAVWGTLKFIKQATNKIQMEFRAVLSFDESEASCVQMGQFKGKRVDPPAPGSICPMIASSKK